MGIIAELCQNHNGDVFLLKEMVFQAKEAGAEFAKIQTFFADDLTDEWKWDYDRLKKVELSWEAHAAFIGWCREADIKPMTSVYSFKYAETLNALGFRHIKIGSAQCLNEDLISRYSLAGFRMFISTGGVELSKIKRLVGPTECVMHCVSKYPSEPQECNILRMLDIPKYWGPSIAYGFSDHTDPCHPCGDRPTKIAIALGAKFIEKHFTILDRWKTKDGNVSIRKETLAFLSQFMKDPWKTDATFMQSMADWGLLKTDQSEKEKQLIQKYQGRWKQDEPGTGI